MGEANVDEAHAKVETNPACGRGVLADETVDEGAGGGEEEGREGTGETGFGLGETVAVLFGGALGGPVGDEVGVGLGGSG